MAISFSSLVKEVNTSNTNPYVTTASPTLHANRLGMLAIMSHHTAGAVSPTSISGPGTTTWVEITHVDYNTIATPLRRLTLYRACNASDQSGTITVTFAGSQSNMFLSLDEATGTAATSGNNGSDGINTNIVTNRNNSATASPFTVTLAALASASDAAFGAFASYAQTQAYSAGSGLTKLGDALGSGTASDSGDIESEWAINVTAVQVTYTTAQGNAGIAVEVLVASATAAVVDDVGPVGQTIGIWQAAVRNRALSPAAMRDEEEPVLFSPVGAMDDLLPNRPLSFGKIPLSVRPDDTAGFAPPVTPGPTGDDGVRLASPPRPVVAPFARRDDDSRAIAQPPGVLEDRPPQRTVRYSVIPPRQPPDFFPTAQRPPALLEDRPPQRTVPYPLKPQRVVTDDTIFVPLPPGMLEDRPPQRTLKYAALPLRQPPDFFFYASQPPQVIDAPWLIRTLVTSLMTRPVSSGDGITATVVAQLTPAEDPPIKQPPSLRTMPRGIKDEVPPSGFTPFGALDEPRQPRTFWQRITAFVRGDEGLTATVAAQLTPADDPMVKRTIARSNASRAKAVDDALPTALHPDDAKPVRPFTSVMRAVLRPYRDDGAPLPVVVAHLTGDDPRPAQRLVQQPIVLRHIVRWAEVFWQSVQQANLAYWQHRLVEGFDVASTSTPPDATDSRMVNIGMIDSVLRYLGF